MLKAYCINRSRDVERWKRMERGMGAFLLSRLGVSLERVEAVDGPAVFAADPTVGRRINPTSQLAIESPSEMCDVHFLDNSGALGCLMSHESCWRRLAAEADPRVLAALILEDDVAWIDEPRLERALAHALPHDLAPRATEWDAVVLGYGTHMINMVPAGWRKGAPDVRFGGTRLRRWVPRYYGSHCYLVSRAGAACLLRENHSLCYHMDFFLELLSLMHRCRVYFWPRSLANQPSFYVRMTSQSVLQHPILNRNYKQFLPDARIGSVLVLLLLLCVALCVVVWSKRT